MGRGRKWKIYTIDGMQDHFVEWNLKTNTECNLCLEKRGDTCSHASVNYAMTVGHKVRAR